MKSLVNKAFEKHREFIEAKQRWDAQRRELERDLKVYVKRKENEMMAQFKFKTDQDMFLLGLDGGSAVADWNPEPFFSRITIGNDTFEPLVGDIWTKMSFNISDDYVVTVSEVKEGPVPVSYLKDLCKFMTQETGVKFRVYEREITEEQKGRYDKYINLDGSIAKRTVEENDYED